MSAVITKAAIVKDFKIGNFWQKSVNLVCLVHEKFIDNFCCPLKQINKQNDTNLDIIHCTVFKTAQ